jgi:hypothetical protein
MQALVALHDRLDAFKRVVSTDNTIANELRPLSAQPFEPC